MVTPRSEPTTVDGGGRQFFELVPPAWWSKSKCRADAGVDLSFFFATTKDEIETAKAYCLDCDALAECTLDALADPHRVGVFGGMDEDDRRAIHKGSQQWVRF